MNRSHEDGNASLDLHVPGTINILHVWRLSVSMYVIPGFIGR